MNAPVKQQFRLPNATHRTVVIGRTGSGKTTLGAWLLTMSPFDRQPYIVIDYKGDDLLNSVGRIEEIGLNEVPKHPGLYITHPLISESEAVEKWLWRVHARGNVGLFADEGYMLPKKDAFPAILTQGRSKHIPVICLSQRPSWISRFVFSEAEFFAVMHLNEKEDRKRVQEFIPKDKMNVEERLPDYHAYWYDVGRDAAFTLMPVPDAAILAETLYDRLKPRRRLL